jgi:hypothetical protein
MPAQPERDEVIQLVVLRGARVPVDKPALDSMCELPGWAYLCRVAALADRAVYRLLGDVGIDRTGRRAPRLSSNQEVSIGLGARSRVHCSNSVGDTLPRELWGRTAL